MTTASTPAPDQDDLLIRSVSSLVSLVDTQAEPRIGTETSASIRRYLERLDCLALLLSTSRHADVCAVAASVDNDAVTVTVVGDVGRCVTQHARDEDGLKDALFIGEKQESSPK